MYEVVWNHVNSRKPDNLLTEPYWWGFTWTKVHVFEIYYKKHENWNLTHIYLCTIIRHSFKLHEHSCGFANICCSQSTISIITKDIYQRVIIKGTLHNLTKKFRFLNFWMKLGCTNFPWKCQGWKQPNKDKIWHFSQLRLNKCVPTKLQPCKWKKYFIWSIMAVSKQT